MHVPVSKKSYSALIRTLFRWRDCPSLTSSVLIGKLSVSCGQTHDKYFKKRSRDLRVPSVCPPKSRWSSCHTTIWSFVGSRDRETTELDSISARSRTFRSDDEAEESVNEIVFVDDLMSFIISVSWEHQTTWIQAVIVGFETNRLKINVGKLIILLQTVGRGNASANRDISVEKSGDQDPETQSVTKEKRSVSERLSRHLCLEAEEIDERMTKVKRVHTRLTNNVWKWRLLIRNVEWRLW